MNGQLVTESEAGFSVFDSGITGGRMVYETSRTFRGRPFRLEHHLLRLLASMKSIGITSPLDHDSLMRATMDTIEANLEHFRSGEDFVITHNVSAGIPSGLAQQAALGTGPNIFIHLWPLSAWYPERAACYDSGVPVVVVQRLEHPAAGLDPSIKHRDRLAFYLAEEAAQKQDEKAWPLLADSKGEITEGTTGNFLIIRGGILMSPPVEVALPGITRQVIAELAQKLGVDFMEHPISRDELIEADEAFFSASTFIIMPVSRIDGRTLGQPVPGATTSKLMTAFSDLVDLDFVAQGKRYANLI